MNRFKISWNKEDVLVGGLFKRHTSAFLYGKTALRQFHKDMSYACGAPSSPRRFFALSKIQTTQHRRCFDIMRENKRKGIKATWANRVAQQGRKEEAVVL